MKGGLSAGKAASGTRHLRAGSFPFRIDDA